MSTLYNDLDRSRRRIEQLWRERKALLWHLEPEWPDYIQILTGMKLVEKSYAD